MNSDTVSDLNFSDYVWANVFTYIWLRTKQLKLTYQGDILILIGHEKKSPIIQDHTVYMLYGRKRTKYQISIYKNTFL